MFAGVLGATLIGVQQGFWIAIALPGVVIGIGQGMALGALTNAGVANTTSALSGAASGVVNTIHQIGGSVGLSIVVALTSQYTNPVMSYNRSLIFMTIFAVIAVGFSVGILKAEN